MAKEYTLIGGNGTVVSPLEVTEDGDYFAGDSRAFNPVKVRASGSGSSTLAGLTDVDISNPTDGQTLVYNATSGKWENGAGGGGASLVMPNISITMTGVDTATATCDMSRVAIMSAIENGAICIAKITNDSAWDAGNYRLTTSIMVVENAEEVGPHVMFTLYELIGGGTVLCYDIGVFDDAVNCFIDRINSYNP